MTIIHMNIGIGGGLPAQHSGHFSHGKHVLILLIPCTYMYDIPCMIL